MTKFSSNELPDGATLIASERDRQITEEKFNAEHDKGWTDGQLAWAAVSYIIWSQLTYRYRRSSLAHLDPIKLWPWDISWFKPESYLKTLIKAGALIAAEIDRVLEVGKGK